MTMEKLSMDARDREMMTPVSSEGAALAAAEEAAFALERARRHYLRKGYPADWVEKRLHGMAVRGQLTGEWRGRGVREGPEFSKLTRLLHEGTFDVPMEEHRAVKGLAPRQNLRDSMTPLELLLTSLAEETAKSLYQARDSRDIPELERDTREAAQVSRATRRAIERRTGQPVVSHRRPRASLSVRHSRRQSAPQS